MSPDVEFDKETMDRAFQDAADRLKSGAGKIGNFNKSVGELEKTIKRCLGEESDEYWKRTMGGS
ncbi:uncharacterized protein LTR77_001384 [Saxophila tyrrhenica]|uniref:Uncharacterized protein n=1 Tax=Saxophila tyrrhenica TaxID=1690608 RepID=A0AAV9PPU3_9PEZI|nr:hypothetical protein LTR77_001384 [Saxophila tyrrhenica]